jgi:transposase-like protein
MAPRPPKTSRRVIPDGVKTRIIAHIVAGAGVQEACSREGVHRQRFWEWKTKDPAFAELLEEAGLALSTALVEEAVLEALARARALTPRAIERIERGLAITHVNKAMVVDKAVKTVAVPDDSIAAEIALKFLKVIQEFTPRAEVEHSGVVTLEQRLAELDEKETP